MSVSVRALWFIEIHLHDDLDLDTVASVVGVSRFHLSRAFTATVGTPLATYVRSRRLTRAAHTLAAGAPDILSVALDAGYGSHEAFTRAFVQQFGITPEQVRERKHADGLPLQEPVRLDQPARAAIDPPRIVRGGVLRLTGVSARHTGITGLPSQWSRFVPHVGHIDGQVGRVVYGVSYNTDDTGAFDYLCAVEVSQFPSHPPEFSRLTIAPQTYAVFAHREHISSVSTTIYGVLDHALTDAGLTAVDGPFFERYDEQFDSRTGFGGLEIWWPIAAAQS